MLNHVSSNPNLVEKHQKQKSNQIKSMTKIIYHKARNSGDSGFSTNIHSDNLHKPDLSQEVSVSNEKLTMSAGDSTHKFWPDLFQRLEKNDHFDYDDIPELMESSNSFDEVKINVSTLNCSFK